MMHTVDRLGVHIDQCEGCRGIFLDRGELEQVAAAEQRHYAAPPPPYQPDPVAGVHGSRPDSPPPFRAEHQHRNYPDSPRPYGRYPDSPRPYGGGKRKRGGFLENLFD
jgi:Zn-finger nucleic acid-binding protein